MRVILIVNIYLVDRVVGWRLWATTQDYPGIEQKRECLSPTVLASERPLIFLQMTYFRSYLWMKIGLMNAIHVV